MLHFIYGDEYSAVRAKAKEKTDALLGEFAGASLIRIMPAIGNEEAAEELSEQIVEAASTQGLFSEKCVVDIKDFFENAASKSAVLSHLETMADSHNVFVWTERSCDAKTLTAIKKHAESVEQFAAKESKSKAVERFNTFAIADAYGSKDKKKCFTLYHQALMEDIAPEEIHGIIFWQTKAIVLAHLCANATEAGLKPFVYSKAKQFAKSFSKEDILAKAQELVELYHQSRRKGTDLASDLERFILAL